MKQHWYVLKHPEKIISPSLLVYPNRIQHNIDLMISMAGDVTRLRPHVKTYKNANIIQMQMQKGIKKFKCATIAEAELLGNCKAPDVLLAMQPIGPNAERFVKLIQKFPHTQFSTLVDNEGMLTILVDLAEKLNTKIHVWLDINNGMNRTGIAPNDISFQLYSQFCSNKSIIARGFHVYDLSLIHISEPTRPY